MLHKLFNKDNISKWWGAFRNLATYVSFYITIINFFVLLVNTYILGNVITSKLPMPMWLVIVLCIAGIVALLLIAMRFEHKHTVPTYMTYWNYQWWNNGNPLPDEIKKIQKQLDELQQILNKQEQK